MQIIDEIIDALSSDDVNLQTALLKTKVLLRKLGEKELAEWVNKELNGYNEEDEVPAYRLVKMTAYGNLFNGYVSLKNQPLDLSRFTDKLENDFTTRYMREDIGNIEEYTTRESLDMLIPQKLYNILSKSYNAEILQAWWNIPIASCRQIIIEVKSRLLDFMLELSDNLPNDIDNNNIRDAINSNDVRKLFNGVIFGNNTTIVIGNDNSQNINNVIAHDFKSLEKTLLDNKISQSDIDLLKDAINKDKAENNTQKDNFGKSVSEWMGDMVTKTISKTADMTVDKLVAFLNQAISDFYGF